MNSCTPFDLPPPTWYEDNCDRGDGKWFGDCAVDDGVVIQERAGEAILAAVNLIKYI